MVSTKIFLLAVMSTSLMALTHPAVAQGAGGGANGGGGGGNTTSNASTTNRSAGSIDQRIPSTTHHMTSEMSGSSDTRSSPSSQRNASAPEASDQAFNRMDTEHHGYLTRQDVRGQGDLERSFNTYDVNRDGRLSRDEFQRAWPPESSSSSRLNTNHSSR